MPDSRKGQFNPRLKNQEKNEETLQGPQNDIPYFFDTFH
jgi:hypothetical protein